MREGKGVCEWGRHMHVYGKTNRQQFISFHLKEKFSFFIRPPNASLKQLVLHSQNIPHGPPEDFDKLGRQDVLIPAVKEAGLEVPEDPGAPH